MLGPRPQRDAAKRRQECSAVTAVRAPDTEPQHTTGSGTGKSKTGEGKDGAERACHAVTLDKDSFALGAIVGALLVGMVVGSGVVGPGCRCEDSPLAHKTVVMGLSPRQAVIKLAPGQDVATGSAAPKLASVVRPWPRFEHRPPSIDALYSLVPHSKDDQYFRKNDNLDAVVARIKAQTGQNVVDAARFPCRLFAMIDMIEWNATYGFLSVNTALALYPKDPEVQLFLKAKTVVPYVFGDVTKRDVPHWGDIHFPIAVPEAGTFDLVLFAQTLEHLYDPVLCLRNLYDALAPGGFLFTSVPFLNHLHMERFFFSMPTATGLAVWLETAGFEVLRVGVFGNKQYIYNLADHITWWPRIRAYLNRTGLPRIVNDAERPVQSWALARKPLA